MKTGIIKTILAGATLLLTSQPAVGLAGDSGANGLLLGAGGGALMGQAIGRDTEGTLLGTAIGGVLGYIIGNEMDKDGMVAADSYRPGTIYRRTEWPADNRRPRHDEGWLYQKDNEWRDWDEWNNGWRNRGPECRETEILAYVDGRPEKVIATSCLENGEWVMVQQRPIVKSHTVIIERRGHGHLHRTDWPGRHERRHHRERW